MMPMFLFLTRWFPLKGNSNPATLISSYKTDEKAELIKKTFLQSTLYLADRFRSFIFFIPFLIVGKQKQAI